jgi:hypothetical protein
VREIWPNGTVYIGDYVNYKKHGKGEMTWPDEAKYVGQFRDNKINGYGKKNLRGFLKIF